MWLLKKILRFLLWLLIVLLIAGIIFVFYVRSVAEVPPPPIADSSALQMQRMQADSILYTIGPNWLHKSSSGLFEMYTSGPAFERGVVNGKHPSDQKNDTRRRLSSFS
jgi:isopenicillin-N N-acyltransferase-like protein